MDPEGDSDKVRPFKSRLAFARLVEVTTQLNLQEDYSGKKCPFYQLVTIKSNDFIHFSSKN